MMEAWFLGFCWNISVKIGCFYICFQDEQNTAPLSNLLEIVNTVRSFGNHSFKQSRYENAKAHYKTVDLHCPCHCTGCVCVFFLTCTMSIYDVNGLCIYIFILHKYTGSESAGKPGNTERCGEGEGQHSSASSVFEPFFHWASPWQATQSPEIWQQSLGDRLRQHKGSFPLWTG